MAGLFGTRQNNDGADKKSINTRIYQFKNKDGFEPSSLSITGWDEMMSLRINPTLPPDKQSKEQIFDYDKFVSTSLSLEKAMLLLYKINKDIIPAIENSEDKNIGISVGGDSLVTIGTGKTLGGDEALRLYLAIHKGLNPDTKKPEQSIYYEFKKAMTIDDYNAETGEYTISEGYEAEFNLFVELLKSFIRTSNFNYHNNRYGNRFTTDRINNTIYSIADKVGADSGSSRYNNNGNSYRKNVFGNNGGGFSDSSSNYTSDDAALENIGDLNDLMNE